MLMTRNATRIRPRMVMQERAPRASALRTGGIAATAGFDHSTSALSCTNAWFCTPAGIVPARLRRLELSLQSCVVR